MKRLLFLMLLVAQQSWAAEFEGLGKAIRSGDYGSIKAVLIAQDGELLYERYFRETEPDDLHQMHSVTKSVGSALVGIAHRQGKISLDTTLSDLFVEYYPMNTAPYQDKRLVTVESILKQRHGILWDEWSVSYLDEANPVYQAIISGDWYGKFLREPRELPQDSKFTYSTMASTLMSRMIRWASGMSTEDFAAKELFGPLGIDDWHFELYSDGGLGTGTTEFPNPDGDVPLGFGLWLSPASMLKFGEMYRKGGIHEGRRILDEEWIRKSWVTYSNSENTPMFKPYPGHGYGYQWWKQRITDTRGRTFTNNYASGWARQHIMVFPELDLVVVSVSDDYTYGGRGMGTLLSNIILPDLNPILDERFNGAWYNPETDGQGLTLEVQGDGAGIVGFWYTYDNEGNKRWFIMVGAIEGDEAVVSVIRTKGGVFLEADPVSEEEWGTARIVTVDCNHIIFEIESDEIVTSLPLTRLTGTCNGG
jgi:CubicO group peptidase (beta-lactamase class C family)